MNRVLIIAGSDSGGGAGIQGDIKTVTCLGGYAATAITALTAQNTLGVFGILDVPEEFIEKQIRLVLDDIGADAIKTGMLNKVGVINIIADILSEYPDIPLVLDPVMFAKGGAALLPESALDCLKKRLIPRAAIITPNIPEAEYLAGMTIDNYKPPLPNPTPQAGEGMNKEWQAGEGIIENMKIAARKILSFGCKAVLLKGGHAQGNTVTDLLITENEEITFNQPRIQSRNTHGTGCTLASAIATGIAQQMPLKQAVEQARNYVFKAIETAENLGKGHGPLNHGHVFCKKA